MQPATRLKKKSHIHLGPVVPRALQSDSILEAVIVNALESTMYLVGQRASPLVRTNQIGPVKCSLTKVVRSRPTTLGVGAMEVWR